MPLVNTREMFKRAYEEGYAIGAFNVNNMEIVRGNYRSLQGAERSRDSSGVRRRP